MAARNCTRDEGGRLHTLSRVEVRRAFGRRFTAERMAADYVRIYRTLSHVKGKDALIQAAA
jgi:hypothetical protein